MMGLDSESDVSSHGDPELEEFDLLPPLAVRELVGCSATRGLNVASEKDEE
jgi:hypothetical protein